MTKQNLPLNVYDYSEKMILLFLILLMLTIKVLFIAHANVLPDEAYYWLWSKNLAFSYFDHPPLNAWAQAFASSFFNNKYFIIRALPIFGLAVALTIIIFWQRHMFKKLDYTSFLNSVTLFLAFPIYSIFFSISFPDYLLITFLLATSYCLFLYFERNNNGASGIQYWYLAAILFSLALLTKYNAILLGTGVLIFILYHKKKINGPSYSHIIGATFIIILIQMPVFFWNISNELASFSFHLSDRLDSGKEPHTIVKNIGGFLVGTLLAFSPIFIFNLKNNLSSENYSNNIKNFIAMGKFVFVFSLTFCISLSLITNVLYYWFTPAIVLLTPFLINIIKSKSWRYLHIIYGVIFSLILSINTIIYPISAFFGEVDRETAIVFGWEKITKIIREEKKQRGIEKVIFSDYRLGSLYIFHSDDFEADVVMEQRRTQFDIWRGEEDSFEENTLIVSDKDFPLGKKILSNFETIKLIRKIDIHIGNKCIKEYHIFLGRNP